MPLYRNSIQGNITIQEFYQRFIDESSYPYYHIAKKMMKAVSLIETIFIKTQIWGLTSHANLILQSEDRNPLLGDEIVINCWLDKSNIDRLEFYLENNDLKNSKITTFFKYHIGLQKYSHNDSSMKKVEDINDLKSKLLSLMNRNKQWNIDQLNLVRIKK